MIQQKQKIQIFFLLLDLSEFSVSVESSPFIFCYFYISAHCYLFSYLFCYIHDQNFARGSPLFSFFLVYARIRISTIEVKANIQQVLAVSALTGKLLRLHIKIRVTSCLTDWLPNSMVDP